MRGLSAIAVHAVLALAGCSSTFRGVDWTGHNINDVIAKLGPATRISSYPFGGSVYVWENHVLRSSGPDVTSDDGSMHAVSVVEREVFMVNDQGIVTGKRTQTVADPATAGAYSGGLGQP